jgi:excisionase family DNA binding protein
MNPTSVREALPTDEDIALARVSGRILSTLPIRRNSPQSIDFQDDYGEVHSISLPGSVLPLLETILSEIAKGNAVSIIPVHSEITTQEAADMLNVSRPFLVKLLEKKEIPFHKVGTHRRVYYGDLIGYKQRIDANRRITLDELAAQAQELGMGY